MPVTGNCGNWLQKKCADVCYINKASFTNPLSLNFCMHADRGAEKICLIMEGEQQFSHLTVEMSSTTTMMAAATTGYQVAFQQHPFSPWPQQSTSSWVPSYQMSASDPIPAAASGESFSYGSGAENYGGPAVGFGNCQELQQQQQQDTRYQMLQTPSCSFWPYDDGGYNVETGVNQSQEWSHPNQFFNWQQQPQQQQQQFPFPLQSAILLPETQEVIDLEGCFDLDSWTPGPPEVLASDSLQLQVVMEEPVQPPEGRGK
jgi:hypothetical protein